ncbi:hypothetical protein ACJX0J_026098, partial [Zea mays]
MIITLPLKMFILLQHMSNFIPKLIQENIKNIFKRIMLRINNIVCCLLFVGSAHLKNNGANYFRRDKLKLLQVGSLLPFWTAADMFGLNLLVFSFSEMITIGLICFINIDYSFLRLEKCGSSARDLIIHNLSFGPK